MSITIDLPMPPSNNVYYRHVGHKVLISEKGRAYRDAVHVAYLQLPVRKHFKGRLSLTIHVYPPTKGRRDLDNIPKAIQDSLTYAKVYEDDSQIDELHIHRGAVDKERPGVRVEVKEIAP